MLRDDNALCFDGPPLRKTDRPFGAILPADRRC